MTHRFAHLQNFLASSFFQGWKDVRGSASRAIDAVVENAPPQPLLQITQEIEALLREPMSDEALDQCLCKELGSNFSPLRAGQRPRHWLAHLARELAVRAAKALPAHEGVLRDLLEHAFPDGWTARAMSPEARIERFVQGAPADLRRTLAAEIDAVLAFEPTRAGCDRFMRDELKSRYLPRDRDGGARPWLQQIRRAALRGDRRSVL